MGLLGGSKPSARAPDAGCEVRATARPCHRRLVPCLSRPVAGFLSVMAVAMAVASAWRSIVGGPSTRIARDRSGSATNGD